MCGKDAPEQQILTQCPKEKFCSLSSGEVCIYGIRDIPQMTQIAPKELAAVVYPENNDPAPASASIMSGEGLIVVGAVFLAGLGIGGLSRRMLSRMRQDN